MMALPFVGLFLGLAFGWAGKRGLALLMWAISLGLVLVLFKVHATDPLRLDF